jgi:anaerobic selenocysteine-containing dehydrogenase
VFDSRQPDEVFMELAERVGILYGERGLNAQINTGMLTPIRLAPQFQLDVTKRYSCKELADRVIKSVFGENASVDACRNNAEVPKRVLPHKAAYPYGGFPGSQTRYALYMDRLKTYGEDLIGNLKRANAFLPGLEEDVLKPHFSAVPHWIEKPGKRPAGLDLFAVNWKPAQFTFGVGGAAENPWLHEVSQFDQHLNVVCLNPKTARARGLADGTAIWVESKFGKVRGKVKISEAFHPEVVGIGGLFGHRSPGMNPLARRGMHFNSLMSPNVEDCDPLGGGFSGAPRVRIYKA